MTTEDDAPQQGDGLVGGQVNAAISNAVVRVHREYLGRGPTKARTSIRDDTVVTVLHDTLTKAERSLVDDGRRDEVLRMRHLFQHAMRADITAAVEAATGRRTIAFMSDNHLDPDMAVEIVMLQPEG